MKRTKFSLPEEMREELRQVASREDRSESSIIRAALRKELDRRRLRGQRVAR